VAKKLETLLAKQTEATKVTAEAAKQLALLNISRERGATIDERHSADSSTKSSAAKHVLPRSDERRSKEASASSSNVSSSSVSSKLTQSLKSLVTKTESNIPEILSAIDKTERSGETLPKTISDAIEQLTAASHRSAEEHSYQSISEEIAAALSVSERTMATTTKDDRDESTLKEASSVSTPAPSVMSSEQDLEATENELSTDKELTWSANGKDVCLFSLQMFRQHLEEESVRAKHQYILLKTRETLLNERVKAELEALAMKRKSIGDAKGCDDEAQSKLSSVKKKERAILMDYKKKKSEFERLKTSIKVAERERKLILKEQKRILKEAKNRGNGFFSSALDLKNEPKRTQERVKNEESHARGERSKFGESDHPGGADDATISSSSTITQVTLQQSGEECEIFEVSTEPTVQSQQQPAQQASSSKMESLKREIGVPLKNPLSPIPSQPPQPKSPQPARIRHPSADSDESLVSLSHTDTASDHSDYEIRIQVAFFLRYSSTGPLKLIVRSFRFCKMS
jgi:hypothetical protein